MYAYCDEHNLPYKKCGKLIVATREEELPRLDALWDRAIENGCEVTMVDAGNGIEVVQKKFKIKVRFFSDFMFKSCSSHFAQMASKKSNLTALACVRFTRPKLALSTIKKSHVIMPKWWKRRAIKSGAIMR